MISEVDAGSNSELFQQPAGFTVQPITRRAAESAKSATWNWTTTSALPPDVITSVLSQDVQTQSDYTLY